MCKWGKELRKKLKQTTKICGGSVCFVRLKKSFADGRYTAVFRIIKK